MPFLILQAAQLTCQSLLSPSCTKLELKYLSASVNPVPPCPPRVLWDRPTTKRRSKSTANKSRTESSSSSDSSEHQPVTSHQSSDARPTYSVKSSGGSGHPHNKGERSETPHQVAAAAGRRLKRRIVLSDDDDDWYPKTKSARLQPHQRREDSVDSFLSDSDSSNNPRNQDEQDVGMSVDRVLRSP